jgi:hypothetical protein
MTSKATPARDATHSSNARHAAATAGLIAYMRALANNIEIIDN